MLQADLSHEVIAVDVEDAIRMNADCMAVQTFIGGDGQLSSIDNLSQTINAGFRYSIPTLGVCAVGKDMERTPRFFKLATRIIAEMGCQMVKTYDCDDFEEVVAACPVPIVVAGGKKLPEKDALHLAYDVIRKGAHGVDMGRNIFQSTHPIEMAQCVNKIVHEGMTDVEAWEMFQDDLVQTQPGHHDGVRGLEDVTAHVNAVGTLADDVVGEVQGVLLGKLLAAGDDDGHGAGSRDLLESSQS